MNGDPNHDILILIKELLAKEFKDLSNEDK